jgi:hypothetical protein
MPRTRHLALLVAATVAVAAPALAAPNPPAGAPIGPNAGAVSGGGTLTDTGGKPIGTWAVTATLAAGKFSGTGTVTIAGQTFSAPLNAARSFVENSRCVFAWEQGRARAEVSGPCTTGGLGGYLSAFIPAGEIYSVTGFAAGQLKWGGAGAKGPAALGAAPSGVVPTGRLGCGYMERVGGNVAGDLPRYEYRVSNMGFLQLGAGGTYQTAHTSGRWVRAGGNAIKLVGGQFAGAIGRLQPDNSGAPAVYFERDENRDARGVPIVDVYRTFCAVQNRR